MELTDAHFQTFQEQGFVVIENFYPEEKRAEIAAAVRRTLPSWDEVKDDPPESYRGVDDFPYEDMFFNHLILDPPKNLRNEWIFSWMGFNLGP